MNLLLLKIIIFEIVIYYVIDHCLFAGLNISFHRLLNWKASIQTEFAI